MRFDLTKQAHQTSDIPQSASLPDSTSQPKSRKDTHKYQTWEDFKAEMFGSNPGVSTGNSITTSMEPVPGTSRGGPTNTSQRRMHIAPATASTSATSNIPMEQAFSVDPNEVMQENDGNCISDGRSQEVDVPSPDFMEISPQSTRWLRSMSVKPPEVTPRKKGKGKKSKKKTTNNSTNKLTETAPIPSQGPVQETVCRRRIIGTIRLGDCTGESIDGRGIFPPFVEVIPKEEPQVTNILIMVPVIIPSSFFFFSKAKDRPNVKCPYVKTKCQHSDTSIFDLF